MYYNLQIPKLYIQFSPPESCRCIDLSLKETGMYFNLQMPKLYIQFSPPESCRCIDCYLSRRQVCILIFRRKLFSYRRSGAKGSFLGSRLFCCSH